jgi:microcystin-dependent protein
MSNTPEEEPGGLPIPIDLSASLTRRDLLRLAAGGTVLLLPGMLAGCEDDPLQPLRPPAAPGDQPVGEGSRGDGDPFLSEIMITSFSYPPKGWALCNGQLLPINQNQALFSLLGTTYGGDGRVNFALPNVRGRVPIHFSAAHSLGEAAGAPSRTISQLEMPTHTHGLSARSVNGAVANPTNNFLGAVNGLYSPSLGRMVGGPHLDRIPLDAIPVPVPLYSSGGGGALTSLSPQSITNAGGSQAHQNMQPYLVLSFCIALQGIFPSKS